MILILSSKVSKVYSAPECWFVSLFLFFFFFFILVIIFLKGKIIIFFIKLSERVDRVGMIF